MRAAKLLLALLLAPCIAQACPDEIRIVQRDSTDTSTWTRILCPTTSQPSLLIFDPTSQLPQLAALSGLTWNGTTLTAASQVNADWNASSGAAQILNKPSIPTILPRAFSYPTRGLGACFQLSTTRDAQVAYGVDITVSVTLGGTPKGSAYLRTYTDNACTQGQQTVISGSSGLPSTLSVVIGLQNLGTVSLPGVIPAGLWARIETVADSGSPTFAARQGQEVLQ